MFTGYILTAAALISYAVATPLRLNGLHQHKRDAAWSPWSAAPSATSAATSAPAASVTTAPSATAAPSQPSASAPAGGSGGSAPTESFSGDITYYAPGLGACGMTNTDSELIVAIGEDLFDEYTPSSGNPNDNTLCGLYITINHGGDTATAKVVDRCPGCDRGSLDMSSTLFAKFADLSVGRVSGVDWSFN